MQLKTRLFVQDLADWFGMSISLVSRICITWINLLYFELKDQQKSTNPKGFADF